MAQTPTQFPITQVSIGIHEIFVEITTQTTYPDQLDDVSNRAYALMERIMQKAKEQDIDIRRFNYSDSESDFEDEDEEEEAD